ncbi:hypothetical protein IWW50_005241, partial [Coemansia erecta]
RDKKTEAVTQVTFDAELLSAAKTRVLRQTLRNRLVWTGAELVLLLVLLALLIVHSFRLHHKGHNTYARWSSSWVMILLSVLVVLAALVLFVTFYHFRTRLSWIRDPRTTDDALANPQAHPLGNSRQGAFRILRRDRASGFNLPPAQQRQQQPWLNTAGRNSRAWREMRARQRESSPSSPSSIGTPSLRQLNFAGEAPPRRPPPSGRRRQTADNVLD